MGVIKWLKLVVGINDDEKIKILSSMPNGDRKFYLWICLLSQAAKTNDKGLIYLNKNISYTNKMLSTLFGRPVEDVEEALKIFVDLEMIEIDEKNVIKVLSWEKHQNVEGMEKVREQTRKRVEKHREKHREEELNGEQVFEDDVNVIEENFVEGSSENCNVTVTQQNKTQKEIENETGENKEKKIETKTEENKEKYAHSKKEKDKDECAYSRVGEYIRNEIALDMDKSVEEKEAGSEFFLIIEKKFVNENDIMEYIKKVPGKIKGANLNSIRTAVITHGAENVKLAIDKAIEVNRLRMNYVNGILNNWQIEGYPTTERKTSADRRTPGVTKFNNFEPRNYDYNKLEKELLGWE